MNRNRSAKNAHTLRKGYGWGHKKDAKRAASKLDRKGAKFAVRKEAALSRRLCREDQA